MSITNRLAVVALVSCGSTIAAPVSINFDDLGPEVIIGSTYSALGVTFVNAKTVEYRNGQPVFCAFPGSTCPTTIKSADPFAHGFQPQPDTPIGAVFDFAIQSASLTAISINGNGFLLRAFDSVTGGNLVDSAQVLGTDNPFEDNFFFTLNVTGSNIRRIEFSQLQYINQSDDTSFDNLVFEAQAAIPEPGTTPLAVAALAFTALLTRRRASASQPGQSGSSDFCVGRPMRP